MPAPPPDQCPKEFGRFLDWLGSRVRLPGWAGEAPLPQADGSLAFRFGARGRSARLLWLLAAPATDRALAVPGLAGAFLASGLSPEEVRNAARQVRGLVRRFDPEPLRLGPRRGATLALTESSLGGCFLRHLTPKETRWGPFLFQGLAQAGARGLRFRFAGDEAHPGLQVLAELSADLPAGARRGRTARRKDLRFALVADSRTPEQRGLPEFQVERLLGFSLARALAFDPAIQVAAAAAGAARPWPTEPAEDVGGLAERHSHLLRPDAFIRSWNASYRWHRFLYPVSRCITNLFRLGPEETLVAHESLECVHNEPPWLPSACSLFAHRRGARVGEFWQANRIMLTDLDDESMAKGSSQRRLEETLDEAARATPRGGIVVHSGCLPNVVGDNPIPAMRRLERRTKARFYWISSTNDWRAYTARLLCDRLKEAAPARARRDPLGVAMVGGLSPRENRELLGLLSRIGLHPLGVLLPEVGTAAVEKVAKASLFVWANQSTLRDISELAFEDLPVSLLRPSSPVGLRGTWNWLRQISAQLPGRPAVARGLKRLENLRAWDQRLSGLRQETAACSLIFAADRDELPLYLDSTPLFAFSLLGVVLEMGFRVRLLVKGELASYSDAAARLQAQGLSGVVTLEAFRSPPELQSRLAAPGRAALFSHFTADPRAVSAGLNSFSDEDLESGIEGFFRSAERLLRLCRLRPFAAQDRGQEPAP